MSPGAFPDLPSLNRYPYHQRHLYFTAGFVNFSSPVLDTSPLVRIPIQWSASIFSWRATMPETASTPASAS